MKLSMRFLISIMLLGTLGTAGIARTVFAAQPSKSPQPPIHRMAQQPEQTNPLNDSDTEVNSEKVPAPLSKAGEQGEVVYDMAKIKDWAKAKVGLNSLQDAAQQLRRQHQIFQRSIAQLDAQMTALNRAVSTQNSISAMHEANQITFTVAQMTKPFEPQVPVEITFLDYYGRELEIGSQPGNTGKFQQTTRQMRRTWNLVRPSIMARGGSAQAQQFEALVIRVETAKSPAQYGQLAKPVLDAVDSLEKVFQ